MAGDWFWEGNVAVAVARHLKAKGWEIKSIADTASKQHGVDVLAQLDGRRLAVEVKGYPSVGYADPRRANEVKRTAPANQANKWFSHALLAVMKYRGDSPSTEIAMAFPDYPTYRNLIVKTEKSLRMLRLRIYLVASDGRVVELLGEGG